METSTLESSVFPFQRPTSELPAEFAILRSLVPPLVKVKQWDGSYAWLATRYEVVKKLLSDPRISSDTSIPGFPGISEAQKEKQLRSRSA